MYGKSDCNRVGQIRADGRLADTSHMRQHLLNKRRLVDWKIVDGQSGRAIRNQKDRRSIRKIRKPKQVNGFDQQLPDLKVE